MRRPAIAALVLVVLAACGGSFTDKANKTLATSLAATNAARDQFLAWDKAHQLELVDGATTKDEAEAKLAAYRMKRQPVLKAFTAAYVSIAAAAAMLPLVDKGIKREFDLIPLLSDAVSAALAVKEGYDALRGGP
jgi:hypothetical protein